MATNQDAPWEDEAWLREKHIDEGMTLQEMADYAGTTFDTVRYYMRKHGVERIGNARPDAKYRDADYLEREYWENGKSLNEIAEDCDTDGPTILRWMKRHDIPRRTPHQEKGTAWKDEETLRRLYWDEGMTLEEIGNELGCSMSTVSGWMQRLGVDRIKTPDEKPAYYDISKNGHPRWKSKHNGTTYSLKVHQLLLIAEGADPYKVFSGGEYHTHHKNGVPWDNRPENLELLTASEHLKEHHEEREHGPDGRFIS